MSDKRRSVLVFGGTGVMGTDLIRILTSKGFSVTVTSRYKRKNDNINVHYIKGNAKDDGFLSEVLKHSWDCIIDFMSYSTDEFRMRVDSLLAATGQYIFISSARVYAESKNPLTEDSPRLCDSCDDLEYLKTDEYGLAKARQEDLLILKSTRKNYTIVRPSLTYNSNRLQFAISEKEEWLYRAINGRSIIFPSDMMDIKTTMAYGYDVAVAIAELVGNLNALGQAVHITGREVNTWKSILDIYQNTFRTITGSIATVFMADDSMKIATALGRTYQIKYARRINRTFDCRKLDSIVGELSFTNAEEGLKKSLEGFFSEGQRFGAINGKAHAYFDLISKEYTPVSAFSTKKEKFKYLVGRYTPYFYFKGL